MNEGIVNVFRCSYVYGDWWKKLLDWLKIVDILVIATFFEPVHFFLLQNLVASEYELDNFISWLLVLTYFIFDFYSTFFTIGQKESWKYKL